jgi:hypothetical protein
MTNITHTLRTFNIGNYEVEILIDEYYQGCNWLADLFDVCDHHKGGVTVRNPVDPGNRNHHQWYKPTQYSLAELASDYAKQGRDNPSAEAYASTQRELGWYITAGDFGFTVTVSKCDIELANTNAGFGFDYSWEYCDQSLEEYTLHNFKSVIRECVHEAIAEARDAIRRLAA